MQNSIFFYKNNSGKIISHFKDNFKWFAERWSEMNIEHKQLFGKMIDSTPSLGFYLDKIFQDNLNEDGDLPNEVWRVTSGEADLLLMLALPYDESEMVLKDDTGILDASGNKILAGGTKSFRAQ